MAVNSALPDNRALYTGQLLKAFAKDDNAIKFRALENLRPYTDKLTNIWIEKSLEAGTKVLQLTDSYEFLRGIKEFTGDALAHIIAGAGLTPKELTETGSAVEFLDLLGSKGAVTDKISADGIKCNIIGQCCIFGIAGVIQDGILEGKSAAIA